MKNNKLNILVGIQEIAGYYNNLVTGLNKINCKADFVTITDHPFSYGTPTSIHPIARFMRAQYQKRKLYSNSIIAKLYYTIVAKCAYLFWVLFAILEYDVFIFSFGKTFLWNGIDTFLLKLLSKKVIVVFHGSDSRLPYANGFIHHGTNEEARLSDKELIRRTKSIYKTIMVYNRNNIIIIANPFSFYQFAERDFINFINIGLPISYSIDNPKPSDLSTHVVRILHSPSHPISKGTKYIRKAINSLNMKGYSIDYVEVINRNHSDVLAEIAKCDFVIDQIYSDFPLAGFATEAAWFGKPAVVGGYRLEYLKQFVDPDMWPPSKICHPDDLEIAIESLISNITERINLGERAMKFVREKWNSIEVARRYLKIIEDQVPREWMINPKEIVYIEGGGQSIYQTIVNVRNIIDEFGIEGLGLAHRPDIERAYLDLIN